MKKIIAYILIATLAFSLIGCSEYDDKAEPNTPSDQGKSIDDTNKDTEKEEESKEEKLDEDDKEPEKGEDKSEKESQKTEKETVKGTLYFSDENAEYLNAEERELDELTAESLLNALIDGPKNDANRKTIPEGTKLIDVKIKDGVAYANFSKELTEKHWGGSTGEMHTIYSIVNTLALEPKLNIDSVQILIDSEIMESLAGHMDTTGPIKPDLELSKHK